MPGFFDLPQELRDMVYHELWKLHNRVAAYHKATGSGILAYYDGMVLDESEVKTTTALLETDRTWRPNRQSGLPRWLQTNKTIQQEGFAKFCLHACWNIWFVRLPERKYDYIPYPDNMIMSLKHAKSIAVGRILLDHEDRPFTIDFRWDGRVTFHLDRERRSWIDGIAKCVGQESQLHQLKMAFAMPSLLFSLNHYSGDGKGKKPFKPEFPVPHQALLKACTELKRFEIELFHREYAPYTHEILDVEILEQLRPKLAAIMGSTFQETVTRTASPVYGGTFNGSRIRGKQLLDCKLTYNRVDQGQG